MQDIKHRELKMQEARKNTPWREFVKEICSRAPIILRKIDGNVSRIPKTGRVIDKRVSSNDFMNEENTSFGYFYNFEKCFFENYLELYKSIPMPNILHIGDCDNSDYSDNVAWIKNAYLTFFSGFSENILYSLQVKENVNNVFNSVMVWSNSDNIYMSAGIINSYNIFFSKYIKNCSNVWFSTNLLDCQDCLFCSDLERKKFHINNKEFDSKEYHKIKGKLLQNKKEFLQTYQNIIEKGVNFGSSEFINSTFSLDCNNISNSQYCFRVTNGRNIILFGSPEDNQNSYDQFSGGSKGCKDLYGGRMIGAGSQNIYCSDTTVASMNMYYCFGCLQCSYCFGCIGLKNKSFCILNKQYTKEERFEKANQIFAQMDADGTLGKFFPPSMNPFYFNDTVAYLIDDSFTKEEVTKEGYLWRNEEIKVDVPEGTEVIEIKDLDQYEGFDTNGNWNINPDILKKVIKDEKGNYYRIVKMEYDFLMKYALPLPRLHWLDRIKLGFKFK